ncbi:hypothetical protein GCM10009740_31850 [Terrabacter terrae]|uniref:Uncharacterized protein n=1 Tax=Terrabacter terrae TaxID=318434 RepID=A0ABP5G4E5_9MICO
MFPGSYPIPSARAGGGGLDYGEAIRDFRKRSAILDAAEAAHPGSTVPAAYVGVFANAAKPRFNIALLRDKLERADLRPDVLLTAFDWATGDVSFESAAGRATRGGHPPRTLPDITGRPVPSSTQPDHMLPSTTSIGYA